MIFCNCEGLSDKKFPDAARECLEQTSGQPGKAVAASFKVFPGTCSNKQCASTRRQIMDREAESLKIAAE